MTYRGGLGANIAIDNSAAVRAFQAQTRIPATPPPVLIKPAPTPTFTPARPTAIPTTTPVKPTTPVLKIGTPATPKAPVQPPVFKATVPAVTATKSPTVSMKPVAPAAVLTNRTDDGLISKLVASPLPLIAFGIGALLLFNRKKGR